MIDNLQKPMKWWGWGAEGEAPDFDSKPHLWPYIVGQMNMSATPRKLSPPPHEDEVKLPPSNINASFAEAATKHGIKLHDDKTQRLLHCAGKSFRDLWHARQGKPPCAPDAVAYPQSNEEVIKLVAAAQTNDVVLIPFGGGSNIAGCLTPYDSRKRTVISLDMTKMNRLLSVNETAQTAVMQAGALGGVLEEQLNACGWTFGHFPDSFLHSTLGGWIATRSAGMQSDEYGCIENLIAGVKVQTPAGEWQVRPHPRTAAASMKEIVIGSEGAFGVITEATIKIRCKPEHKNFYGYFFPDFASGLEAVRECVQRDEHPLISRLSDYNRTGLSFAFRDGVQGGALKQMLASLAKSYLGKVRGVDFAKCCMMITAFEGDTDECRRKFRAADRIFRKHGGVFAGSGPGESFARIKFDFPHIRDYLWDYGVYADVSETATTWDNAKNLWVRALQALEQAFESRGVSGWCGCHLSHSYRDGASLYFSFAFKHDENGDNLAHYFAIKKAVQDSFLQNGGTLSHHHAVGTDHAPWLEEDISPMGVAILGGVKAQTDPQGIMNPGKLRPLDFEHWYMDIPVAEQ